MYSSLGNSLRPGNAEAVLVPVEGNTYQSVPILEFGSGGDDEEGAGQARMPWLSGKYSFGDRSGLTRFVIGLDEALEEYRGLDDASPSRGTDAVRDPWSEDLFLPHLPIGPRGTGARLDERDAPGPGPRADTRGFGVLFRERGLDAGPVEPPIPRSRRFARVASVAGLVCAASALSVTRAFVPRQTGYPTGPVAAGAQRGRQRRVESTSRESHS